MSVASEFDLLAGHELGEIRGAVKHHAEDPEALNTLVWHKLQPEGYQPSSREGHSLVSHGSNVFMFGGFQAGQRVNSVVSMNLATGCQWSLLQPAGRAPAARSYHAAAMYDGLMLIHGGEGVPLELTPSEAAAAAVKRLELSQPQLLRGISHVTVDDDEEGGNSEEIKGTDVVPKPEEDELSLFSAGEDDLNHHHLQHHDLDREDSHYSSHDRLHQKPGVYQSRRRSAKLRQFNDAMTGVTLGDSLTSAALHPAPKIVHGAEVEKRNRKGKDNTVSARSNATTAAMDIDDPVVAARCFDDLHVLDTMFMRWFHIDAVLAPLPRKGHSMNIAHLEGKDTPTLLVFGGHSTDNCTVSNSIHVCELDEIVSNVSQQVERQNSSHLQKQRNSSSSTSHVEVVKSLRSGGAGTSSGSEVVKNKVVWRTLQCGGCPPAPRYRHTATVVDRWNDPPGEIMQGLDAYASVDSNAILQSASLLIVIGGIGTDPSVALSDIHILNLDTLQWTTPTNGSDSLGRGLAGDGPRHGIFGHVALPIKTARNTHKITPPGAYSQEVNPATEIHLGNTGIGGNTHKSSYQREPHVTYTMRKRAAEAERDREEKEAVVQLDHRIRDMQRHLAYKAYRQPPKPTVVKSDTANAITFAAATATERNILSLLPSQVSVESHFSGEMEILIFGGSSNSIEGAKCSSSAMYAFNFERNTWKRVKTGFSFPPARAFHAAAVVHDWAPLNTPPAAVPASELKKSGGLLPHIVPAPGHGCVILFGGLTSTAECAADTWTLDVQWRKGGVTQYDTSNTQLEQRFLRKQQQQRSSNNAFLDVELPFDENEYFTHTGHADVQNNTTTFDKFKVGTNYPYIDSAADAVNHPDRALDKLHGLNHQRYLVAAIAGRSQPLGTHLETAKDLRIRDVTSQQQLFPETTLHQFGRSGRSSPPSNKLQHHHHQKHQQQQHRSQKGHRIAVNNSPGRAHTSDNSGYRTAASYGNIPTGEDLIFDSNFEGREGTYGYDTMLMQHSNSMPAFAATTTVDTGFGVSTNHHGPSQSKQSIHFEKEFLHLRKERAQAEMLLQKEKSRALAAESRIQQLESELQEAKQLLSVQEDLYHNDTSSLQDSLRASLARETYLKQVNIEAHELLVMYGIEHS